VPASKAYILPNCVDLARFRSNSADPDLIKRYGLAGKKVLLTVGRLASGERYKGFDEVFELIPDLSKSCDVKYIIVGDGDDRERLQVRAERLNITDRVVFAGRIAESEKVAHYNVADVFVMPSSGEGFGIVLIEAAACGLSVIGSCEGGSREALLDGALGTLVAPHDHAELLAAVTQALAVPSRSEPDSRIQLFSRSQFFANVHHWLTHGAGVRTPTRSKA
jgi:glycosyltransferase involved in cell wall biosynthesis